MNRSGFLTTSALAFLVALGIGFLSSCQKEENQESNSTDAVTQTQEPPTSFSPDSAYHYINTQVAFGPRVPNTPEHEKCAEWIASKLSQFGATVQIQETNQKAYNGEMLRLKNIIASYAPQLSQRVLLMAHWDTRPWADQDLNPAHHNTPILGADDAGSGVGVLLEIARQLQNTPLQVGVDIVLFDGEDYGASSIEESWCLGSTHWSLTPHQPGYQATYGILLDMVGSKNATFHWEGYSKKVAAPILSNVWDEAARLGFSQYFVQADGSFLTDDHVPVIKNRKIPCINIVNYNPTNAKGFGDCWHTVDDNMDHISKETLAAVGHTLWSVLLKHQ